MARLDLHMPAPEINLLDFNGNPFRLSQWKGKRHVLLVLNRGFV